MSVKFFILVSSCLALINQTFSQYIVNNSTVGACICVTSGSCSLASGVGSANDGSGNIDLRIINVSRKAKIVSMTHIKINFITKLAKNDIQIFIGKRSKLWINSQIESTNNAKLRGKLKLFATNLSFLFELAQTEIILRMPSNEFGWNGKKTQKPKFAS